MNAPLFEGLVCVVVTVVFFLALYLLALYHFTTPRDRR